MGCVYTIEVVALVRMLNECMGQQDTWNGKQQRCKDTACEGFYILNINIKVSKLNRKTIACGHI